MDFKSVPDTGEFSANSNIGTGARLLTGKILTRSLAFSIAALSSSHTADAIPDLAAALAEPELLLGAIKNSLSFVIITKSDEHASIAAVPAHVPAITEICGTTPEITEDAPSIFP